MARVKRGVTAHKRHKRLLNAAEGRRGTKSKLIRPAREALLHAMAYAYVGRKQRKRQMRALWIVRLNAAARQQRPDLRQAHQRAQAGRRSARSQDPGRHRGPRCGHVCQHRRGRQGPVAASAAPRRGSRLSAQLTDLRAPRARGCPERRRPGRARRPSRAPILGRKRRAAHAAAAASASFPAKTDPRSGRWPTRFARSSRRPSSARRARLEEIALDVRLAAEKTDRHAARPAAVRAGRSTRSCETQREIARIFGQFGFVILRRARRSRPTSSTSSCSTSRATIRRATCGTRSTCAPATTDAHVPPAHAHVARRRSTSCARRSRRSARCCPAAASATRRSTRATASSSSRSRA